MFDQTFVDTYAQTRKPWTVAASLTLQTCMVAAALLVPILRPDVLLLDSLRPGREVPVFMRLQSVPLPPAVVVAQTSVPRPHLSVSLVPLTMPTRVPSVIRMEADAPEVFDPRMTGPVGTTGLTDIPGLTGLPPVVRPVPPLAAVVPAKSEVPKGPVAVGGLVQAARLVYGPRPQYPALAKSARVQGTVRLQAIIAFDGGIRDLKLVSGPPLLVSAALEAVKQWRYRPTTLNGKAVEVITEIDVNFTLVP